MVVVEERREGERVLGVGLATSSLHHPNPDPTTCAPLLHFLSRVADFRLLSHNGHQRGSGHPPSPRPICLPSLLRAKIHDYHGPAREEPCVSMISDTALGCKTAFNPDSLKDDDLAGRLGLQLKELTKLVTVLDKAGLVKTYVHALPKPLNTPNSPYADTARMSSKRAHSVRLADSITTSTTSTFATLSSGV